MLLLKYTYYSFHSKQVMINVTFMWKMMHSVVLMKFNIMHMHCINMHQHKYQHKYLHVHKSSRWKRCIRCYSSHNFKKKCKFYIWANMSHFIDTRPFIHVTLHWHLAILTCHTSLTPGHTLMSHFIDTWPYIHQIVSEWQSASNTGELAWARNRQDTNCTFTLEQLYCTTQ